MERPSLGLKRLSMMQRRVVVTGMGAVTPIGMGVAAFGKSLREGISGEGAITGFDCSNFPVQRGFEVKNFDPRRYRTHFLDPFIQYAVAATTEAFKDAGFETGQVDRNRLAISVGSSKGGVHTLDRFGEEKIEHRPARGTIGSAPDPVDSLNKAK